MRWKNFAIDKTTSTYIEVEKCRDLKSTLNFVK
jgi:hypothetical protein